MAVPYWQADTTRHPLVVVQLVDADGVAQPDPQSLIRIAEGVIERRERVVMVYDITGSKPDALRRRLFMAWLRANTEQLGRYAVASAIVAPTALQRGMLVATFWFVKPKSKVQVFGERSSAIAWAVEQGRLAGLNAP